MGKAGAEHSEVQLEERGCFGERSERRAGLSVGLCAGEQGVGLAAVAWP